jgi:hypothetical protein
MKAVSNHVFLKRAWATAQKMLFTCFGQQHSELKAIMATACGIIV